jgi:hypothetical protein
MMLGLRARSRERDGGTYIAFARKLLYVGNPLLDYFWDRIIPRGEEMPNISPVAQKPLTLQSF